MKLTVIIVNYNVKYFLEQALQSVRAASRNMEIEVIVVDNQSVDGSVEMLRKQFPEVKLIANQENLGFSSANNQGIRIAKGEYVLLLNPDTVVEEKTFEVCARYMDRHPGVGALGVRMIDGGGIFLPESKRGFPSPWVAFCKTFGLSRLFPHSPRFNHYHLGYLDEHQNHEIEVLAGAFMWMRKSALDKVGELDETFFMYGEDIDLSYRFIKAGYKNVYLSETTIIHYKGESTKKGSLNYVRVFYNAMIIFARKHFKGSQASLFVLMLQGAIYFRAFLTLLSNWWKRLSLPIADWVLIAVGLHLVKEFWAVYYFNDSDYYPISFYYFNIPLYATVWVLSIFFSGGYENPGRLRRLARGIFLGTLLLAAIYGFLDLEHRTSRMVLVLGAIWTLIGTTMLRYVRHYFSHQNFKLGETDRNNLVIVGSDSESDRVQLLLQKAGVQKNLIGTVSPQSSYDSEVYLSSLDRLEGVVQIFRVQEIIFCGKDVSSQDIMNWMTRLGHTVRYKIVPEDSMSIIGSHSKNNAGTLYTVDLQFQVESAEGKRQKRTTDLFLALIFVPLLPWLLLRKGFGTAFLQHWFNVLIGRATWVGYIQAEPNLPQLPPGYWTPLTAFNREIKDAATLQRLDLFYAKDYTYWRDMEIVWRGLWRKAYTKENH